MTHNTCTYIQQKAITGMTLGHKKNGYIVKNSFWQKFYYNYNDNQTIYM